MSAFQNPQLFPHGSASAFNHKIINIFAGILRSNFGKEFSAIKEIHLKTGIDCRAIENWFQGRNTPSVMHLLILAHHIPDIIEAFLTLAGKEEIWDDYQACNKSRLETNKINRILDIGDKNEPSNGPIKKLNRRQIWFLEEVQRNENLRIKDIIATWKVTRSTAKRDIAGLVTYSLIRYQGSKKLGKYEVANQMCNIPDIMNEE